MTDAAAGYQVFWKRAARHIRISELAKVIGVRATELSAFEQGKEHPLTAEQIQTLNQHLDEIPVPEPEIPVIEDDESDEPEEPPS